MNFKRLKSVPKDLEQRILKYKPMMILLINKHCNKTEYDEFLADMYLWTWEALIDYKSNRGTKESSFVYTVLKNNVFTKILKKYRPIYHTRKTLSTDKLMGDKPLLEYIESPNKLPYEEIELKESTQLVQDLINLYMSNNTNLKSDVTREVLENHFILQTPVKEISEKYGNRYHGIRVDNLIANFIRFLKIKIKQLNIKLPRQMSDYNTKRLNNSISVVSKRNKYGVQNRAIRDYAKSKIV